MTATAAELVDVLVIGGGPAGLSAATELRRLGAGRVVVVEREQEAGGIPRHTEHAGFGLRDLHRVMDGPAYAGRLVDRAVAAGVELRTATTALAWERGRTLTLVGPGSPPHAVEARAVVVATGTRERPRSARLVPGDRPAGVLTTGALQQLVAFAHAEVGRRAVIVGAEHVSFSAVLTLATAGCQTAALVTDLPRHQTYGALRALTAGRQRVPVLTGVGIARIDGRRRVEAVLLTDGRRLPCDTVLFTGDWVPDHELVRRGGLALSASGGPLVDAALRTERPGVFAAGNLLHGAETADVCALDGRRAAASVAAWLSDSPWPTEGVPLVAEAPIRWVHPSVVRLGETPIRGRYLLRVGTFVAGHRLAVTQGTRVLWTGRSRGALVPNRSIGLPSGWECLVDLGGPPVTVGIADLR